MVPTYETELHLIEPSSLDGNWRLRLVEGDNRKMIDVEYDYSDIAMTAARIIARRNKAVLIHVVNGYRTILEDYSGEIGERGGDFDFTRDWQ